MNPAMSVVPPGGVWSYTQKLPNGNYKQFVGVSETDLFKQVRQFRMNNGMEIGDVDADIRRKLHSGITGQRSLRERVTGWKSNRAYAKLEFVPQDIAEARAKICVDCPFNAADYADSCKECHSSVERDLYAMRAGRETPQDQWLGGCQIAGHENKTAVHLSKENLLHRNQHLEELKTRMPHCWLLHLDEEQTREVE